MSDEQTRPFADFLRDHAQGRTHDELSEVLKDVVKAVQLTHKPGSVTLTINVKPMKETHDALVVTDKVIAKIPTADRKASVFFPTKDGNLVRDDPNQLSFSSLAEVPTVEPAEPVERPKDARERAAGDKA